MGIDAEGYLAQLQALLPPGSAWTRDPDAELTKLLRALAEELARVDGRVEDVLAEADPRTSLELLEDWERVTGIPEPCAVAASNLAERRGAVWAKLIATGGQHRQYYIDLAAALSVDVTIFEFLPFRAGYSSPSDMLANPDGWRHMWQVNCPETIINTFQAGQNSAGDPLRWWGNEALECAITLRKPAHTEVLFAYYL